jgi:hypothetical protein
MYFSNYHGISSGDDVLGATTLHSTYLFADVPTGPGYISFITILNPNAAPASVTATYYASGRVLNRQTVTVQANARNTIAPNNLGLPAHAAVVISANQPIMAERPTYFAQGGITGGYDVVGASTPASDWFFAEGYTGSGFQTDLTIANIDPAQNPAAVSIVLKSRTGTIGTYNLSLGAQSQVIWHVNANNTFNGASPEVSAEVKATGANIVVQREIYFQYHHTVPFNGAVTRASGGTDVMGSVGPVNYSAYSFAEGYTRTGYNEWLTVQNPGNAAEVMYVTVMNGHGRSYSQGFMIPANSRFTLDITDFVQRNMHSGLDITANEVSMTVQTTDKSAFVAERPEYWNTGGSTFVTRGGSDIIGYPGG